MHGACERGYTLAVFQPHPHVPFLGNGTRKQGHTLYVIILGKRLIQGTCKSHGQGGNKYTITNILLIRYWPTFSGSVTLGSGLVLDRKRERRKMNG
jgi:hypothetical protein